MTIFGLGTDYLTHMVCITAANGWPSEHVIDVIATTVGGSCGSMGNAVIYLVMYAGHNNFAVYTFAKTECILLLWLCKGRSLTYRNSYQSRKPNLPCNFPESTSDIMIQFKVRVTNHKPWRQLFRRHALYMYTHGQRQGNGLFSSLADFSPGCALLSQFLPFVNFAIFQIYHCIDCLWIPRLFLSGVAATELQRHLANMSLIY